MKTVSRLVHLMVVFCLILVLSGGSGSSAVAQGLESQNVRTASAASADGLLQFTSGGHALGFSAQGMYAATGSHALHVDFVNANHVKPQADSGSRVKGMAAPLDRVTYADLWDGIDLTYAATAGSIYTTTYTIAPGADAKNIRLRYNAPITLNKDGALTIAFETGTLSESAPIAWQEIDSQRLPVEVSFRTSGQEVSFAVGAYDPRYALTIDPSLVWNTFLGGSGFLDVGYALAVDGSGNVYVGGFSPATWGSPVRAYTAGMDAFAAKLNSSGGLTWNTFLGGSSGDAGYGIAVDGSGNVYVAGNSGATWGSPVRAYTSGSDAFAAKLGSSGGLTWNTFLGGSGGDAGRAIAVDGNGNVYVAGYSNATWGSPVRSYNSLGDGFAAKLYSSGGLTWNTFLGGSGVDDGIGIAVDGSGNVYVAGQSDVTWGSPVRAYTSGWDGFAAKLNSSGGLTWNTFLGGSGYDIGNAIAVDGSGNVYVAGTSDAAWGCSPTACTVRAYTSLTDGFAAKLNSSGGLTWNTFLGGSGNDYGFGIAVDGSGNAYVAGTSNAAWGSPMRAYTSGTDAFAARLAPSGGLTWNAFLGGSGYDYGRGIAVDGNGNVYVAGQSTATWGAPVRAYTSGNDAFVVKLGNIFADVPSNYWAWQWIERLYAAGITGGCASNPLRYCPEDPVSRAQMAVFLERGIHGSVFTPPTVALTFTDTAGNFAQYWIEALKSDGITSGCGPSLYCPDASTTRAEMAIFLLRSKHGASYVPPAASGMMFSDVPSSYWAASWIEQLANEGITSGCGPSLYCPDATVTRAQMAVFLVRTFNLP